jgi:hypothetical protein
MEETRTTYRSSVGNPSGRHLWENIGVDGRKILKQIFKNYDLVTWAGLNWLRIRFSGVFL